MTLASCPRLFEVEAARDGRLTGAELANFERHLSACAVCSREAEALEAPAAALRAGTAGKRDELHVRRERTRLLAAFDAELVGPRRVGSGWRRWPIPVAAALVCGFVLWRARPFAHERPVPSAVVRASNAAEWSEQTQGPLERVELARGSLWLHLDHSSNPGRRLLVILPDGELEDTGTTFTVSADGERTTRIEVQDGSVLLRRRGQLPVAIGAGGTWSPSPASALASAPSAPSAASTAEPIPPLSELAPTRPIAPAPAVHAPSSSEPTAAPRLDPSLEFRAAMTTFNGGDNAGAAAAFARFLAQHPRDPRAEDAAYLRVIALRRSGDAHAVKSAAQDYLRRYPTGFRHAEVEALSR